MLAVLILICLYFLRSLMSCSSSIDRDPMAEASVESTRGYSTYLLFFSGVSAGTEKLDSLELNWLTPNPASTQETNM